MQTVLLVIHLLVVLALVGVVLLQRSEGGGLGLGGGGGGVQGFMTGRGQANALTRATAILAAAFFILSIILSVMAGQNRNPRSIIDSAPRPAAGQSAPQAPAGGNLLDQLRQIDGQAPAGAPAGAQPPRPPAPAQ
jgi:preprotein translocase subunit SecG